MGVVRVPPKLAGCVIAPSRAKFSILQPDSSSLAKSIEPPPLRYIITQVNKSRASNHNQYRIEYRGSRTDREDKEY